MVSRVQPLAALIDPTDGVRLAVETKRWLWPIVALSPVQRLPGSLSRFAGTPSPWLVPAGGWHGGSRPRAMSL
jgi:hypothetical protein